MKQFEANAILRVLDTYGWWNGRTGDGEIYGGRCVCLKMAIDRACLPRGRKDAVLKDIAEQVKLLFPDRVYHREYYMPRSFNDHVDTTENDVRTVINAAAGRVGFDSTLTR